MFNQNLPQSPRILAIANQKGGVGKTTTAINLGTALAAVGESVLIVDLDPQGNASTGLGIVRGPKQKSSYHVLIGEAELEQVIVDSGIPRLHCVPSTIDLLGAEFVWRILTARPTGWPTLSHGFRDHKTGCAATAIFWWIARRRLIS